MSLTSTPKPQASKAFWAYYERQLNVTFTGIAYVEKETNCTIYLTNAADANGQVTEPKLALSSGFLDNHNFAEINDKLEDWWEKGNLEGTEAIVSGKMELVATYTKKNGIYGTLQVDSIKITKEPPKKRRERKVEFPSFSMFEAGGTKRKAIDYELTHRRGVAQEPSSPKPSTLAKSATPVSQTGISLSRALSGEELAEIGDMLMGQTVDLTKETWEEVAESKGAGIVNTNSPFNVQRQQDKPAEDIITATKPKHTGITSGKSTEIFASAEGAKENERKRKAPKSKQDDDEDDDDDEEKLQRRPRSTVNTPTETVQPATSTDKESSKRKRTSKKKKAATEQAADQ
ncbi:MAG: hypothetical protein JOS17DRAFT_781514 [Linnemannia elongata]|nr:MAG: hypothetical protein JOS17DRAFT_781514 [Linnemannia elongata]